MLGADTLRTPHHSRAKQAMRPTTSTAMTEIEPTKRLIGHELTAGESGRTVPQARDEKAGNASVLGRQD